MMRMGRLSAAVVVVALSPLAAMAQPLYPDEALVGTVWASQAPYGWTTVDNAGEITRRTSDGNYVEILDFNDGVYAFMINWWNEAAELNVVEYGVVVPTDDNAYVYLEAEDSHGGITGHGYFRIVDRNTAEIVQIGRVDGGAAAAFATPLTRVEAPPDVPIPETRPTR